MDDKNADNNISSRLNQLANHWLNALLAGAVAYAIAGFIGKKLGEGWSDILQGFTVLFTLIALAVISVRKLRR